jgi:hypothetical protein
VASLRLPARGSRLFRPRPSRDLSCGRADCVAGVRGLELRNVIARSRMDFRALGGGNDAGFGCRNVTPSEFQKSRCWRDEGRPLSFDRHGDSRDTQIPTLPRQPSRGFSLLATSSLAGVLFRLLRLLQLLTPLSQNPPRKGSLSSAGRTMVSAQQARPRGRDSNDGKRI